MKIDATAARPAGGVPDFETLRARAAQRGFTLTATEVEGCPVFMLSRWALSRTLPDLAAVGAFLARVGA